MILGFLIILILAFTAGVLAQRQGFSSFIAKPLVQDGIGIVQRKILSFFESPELLTLDIKHKNFMKLQYNREQAINAGTTYSIENDWINLNVRYKTKTFNAEMRLKGGEADEHMEPDKWSFRLKLKNGQTILGMQEFAVMSPLRRNLLGQWFIRRVFQKEGIITRKYEFVKIILNGENKGIYVLDERYDGIMLTRNQRKEGPVIKIDQTPFFVDKINSNLEQDNYYLSMDFTAFNLKQILQDGTAKKQYFQAKNLIEQFRLETISTSEIFDIDLLAKWIAISDVLGAWHGFGLANMRFYYNPITSKFEPVPDDDYNEKALNYVHDFRLFRLNDQYNNSAFLRHLFSDYKFVERYIKELERVTDKAYLDQVFSEFHDGILKLSNILATDYPFYNFLLDSKTYTYENADRLRILLNPNKAIQAHFTGIIPNKSIKLTIANNQSIPIEILYIKNEEGKLYKPSSKRLILNSRKYLKPVNHEIHKFQSPGLSELTTDSISKLKVIYKILGTSRTMSAEIFPYQEFKQQKDRVDIIREQENIENFSFLQLNEDNRIIYFKQGDWMINNDLIIPANHTVYIPEGVSIDIVNSAMILSRSPIIISGSKDKFVKIFSSDNSGQGITVLNAKKESSLKFVTFHNLSQPKRGDWELTGAINFYESPVHMHEVHFENNLDGDDYVNITRSKFTISHSSFVNSYSDSLDVDFSEGIINDSVFKNCGFGNNNGDCLDLSGSQINLDNIIIDKASDKGFSIGEGSNITIKNSKIQFAKIAVASKDQSEVDIDNLTINYCDVGITVFQKKSEFGPSSIIIKGLKMDEVKEPYLVEEKSFLSIDSNIIPGLESNLKQRFYE